MGLCHGLAAGVWAVCMAASPPSHEGHWKTVDTTLTDRQISEFSWLMALVNICDFRTCNEVWTSYVACKKLTPWVWLQALYELPTACKQFVFQLRTFLEEFCLYHVNICMYIYPCIDTHLRVSVCLALYLITSRGKTLQDSSVAASL